MPRRLLPGVLFRHSRLLFVGLLMLSAGCSGLDQPYPTLIPTLVVEVPTASPLPTETAIPPMETVTPLPTRPPVTATVFIRPTMTPLPTTRPAPTQPPTGIPATSVLPVNTPTPLPVRATQENGAASITITQAQLNQALKGAWRQGMALDDAPSVTFKDGLLVTEMRIKTRPVTLKMTLSMVSTTKGNVLDLRAVAVSTLDGLTTTQVKQGQALVQTMIELLIYQAANGQPLNYAGVIVGNDVITITLLTD
jgi:hypothetical protein